MLLCESSYWASFSRNLSAPICNEQIQLVKNWIGHVTFYTITFCEKKLPNLGKYVRKIAKFVYIQCLMAFPGKLPLFVDDFTNFLVSAM